MLDADAPEDLHQLERREPQHRVLVVEGDAVPVRRAPVRDEMHRDAVGRAEEAVERRGRPRRLVRAAADHRQDRELAYEAVEEIEGVRALDQPEGAERRLVDPALGARQRLRDVNLDRPDPRRAQDFPHARDEIVEAAVVSDEDPGVVPVGDRHGLPQPVGRQGRGLFDQARDAGLDQGRQHAVDRLPARNHPQGIRPLAVEQRPPGPVDPRHAVPLGEGPRVRRLAAPADGRDRNAEGREDVGVAPRHDTAADEGDPHRPYLAFPASRLVSARAARQESPRKRKSTPSAMNRKPSAMRSCASAGEPCTT